MSEVSDPAIHQQDAEDIRILSSMPLEMASNTSAEDTEEVLAVVPASELDQHMGKRKRSNSDVSEDIYNARIINTHAPKRLKQAAKSLSNDEIKQLSKVTALPFSDAESEIELKEQKQGFWAKMPSVSELWKKTNVRTIKLNPLGDVIMVSRKEATVNEDGQKDDPKLEHVQCALQSLQEVASGEKWKELLAKGKKIEIPAEDDYFGLLFVLRVAHGCDLGKAYPEYFDFDQVVKIALIVHKYDASKKVRQEVVARIPLDFKKDPECLIALAKREQWLFVSWVFGLDACFREHLNFLVRNTCVNKEGDMLGCDGDLLTGSFPLAVMTYIQETRDEYVDKLLEVAYDYSAQLRDPDLPICFHPDERKSSNCASLMAGSFARGLAKIGLPEAKPDSEDIPLSINDLEHHLKGIQGHQPQSGIEWDRDASEVPNVHPNCQNKAIWHFLVNRELKGVDHVPLKFLQYLAYQRAS